MAVAYVASATNAGLSTASGSVTVAIPAAAVAGQCALVSWVNSDYPLTYQNPNGATQILQTPETTNAYQFVSWYKFLDVVDIARGNFVFTWTEAVTEHFVTACDVYSGVDSANPINASASAASSPSTFASNAFPRPTTTINGCLIARLASARVNTGTDFTVSVDVGAERHDRTLINGTSNVRGNEISDEQQATAGQVSAVTATVSSGSAFWLQQVIALAPYVFVDPGASAPAPQVARASTQRVFR